MGDYHYGKIHEIKFTGHDLVDSISTKNKNGFQLETNLAYPGCTVKYNDGSTFVGIVFYDPTMKKCQLFSGTYSYIVNGAKIITEGLWKGCVGPAQFLKEKAEKLKDNEPDFSKVTTAGNRFSYHSDAG